MSKVQIKNIFGLAFILLALILAPAFSAYMLGKAFKDIFLCAIISLVFGLIVVITWLDKFTKWFALAFIYGIACACLFPLFLEDSWFFLPLALAFAITTNLPMAIISYVGFLSICVYLSEASMMAFMLYMFTGIFVELLFYKIDKSFNYGLPFSLSALVYIIALLGKVAIYSEEELNFDSLLLPFINFFLSFALMFMVLRIYYAKVVDKEKGQYIDINDQEFPLLAKYKKDDPDVYYNAIHTAYFAEKIARIRNMDIDLAKNGGYYHKIIALECKKENKTLEEICAKYKFPSKATELLQEYNYKSKSISMKETAVVYLSDAVISSILYLQDKSESKDIDYGQIANGLINRKKESGILNESELSFKDIEEIEKVFIGERLYYDFLRRK